MSCLSGSTDSPATSFQSRTTALCDFARWLERVGARVVRGLRKVRCAIRASPIDATPRAGYTPFVSAVIAVEEAEALHAEVRRAIDALGPADDAAYDDLARRTAAFQAR